MWQEWQNCIVRQFLDTNIKWLPRTDNQQKSHTHIFEKHNLRETNKKPVGTPWRGNEWPCHWCFGSGCRSRSVFGWECPAHSARWPRTLASTQTWRRRKGGSTRHGIWCARRSLSHRGPRDPPQPQLSQTEKSCAQISSSSTSPIHWPNLANFSSHFHAGLTHSQEPLLSIVVLGKNRSSWLDFDSRAMNGDNRPLVTHGPFTSRNSRLTLGNNRLKLKTAGKLGDRLRGIHGMYLDYNVWLVGLGNTRILTDNWSRISSNFGLEYEGRI